MTLARSKKSPKPKPCAICKTPFIKRSMTHVACSVPCSMEIARRKREKSLRIAAKVERKATAAQKERIKPRSRHIKAAQISFNKFINKRDFGLPCCACGLPINGPAHASHFLSIGAHPNLRFDEKNCHSGCAKCNVFLHGNLIRYRENLVLKIGIDDVLLLESNNEFIKFSIEDLICIKKKYDLEYKLLNNLGADVCV